MQQINILPLLGQVGPQGTATGDGGQQPLRQGRQGELIKSDLHGRFYEQNYRGNLFTFGASDTALVAVNAISTAGATAKPIIGVYNPPTSGKNLVILKAIVAVTTVGATAVSEKGFFWVGSAGNPSVSTGSSPLNCATLAASGSIAKAFAMTTALTGLTNNLALLRAAAIGPCLNAAGPATAISQPQSNIQEDVDGSLICPPGGVIALQCGVDVSANASNLSVGLVWEEVPV